ncbi:hypothetical protein SUGI_0961070 [Cryptomeria japonica]|nr:hypothetical protein SUGI_0961070 [Cryptomeria japonica]
MEGKNSAHPLLKGGRPAYPHGFSSGEIESLAALCDTFIPALHCYGDSKAEDAHDFRRISGSQFGVPDYIAGMVTMHFPRAAVLMVRLVLLCLYTRLGTLLLCGRASLSKASPFLHLQNFAAIPPDVREKIVLQWSRVTGSIFDPVFHVIFKTFKALCLYLFYSKADESGSNPCWKAIDYSPPYIPQVEKRALEQGIIDASSETPERLESFLMEAGFPFESSKESEDGSRIWKVKCDCVVVGSGAGGGVAAGKLAAAGHRVLVVEKGKYFAAGDLSLLEGPSMDQMYARGGLLSTPDVKVSILAGATVGGGSSINWSACIRTPDHVLKEWAEVEGLTLFQSQEYESAMTEVWERAGVNSENGTESFQNRVLRKGCGALGFEVTDVSVNATPGHNCGSACSFGCRTGQKKGTPDTWLLDAVAAGARILTGCEATRVTWSRNPNCTQFKEKRATGVLCRAGRNQILVEAKATIVAGGTLMTPGLLLASGLRNPNIGKNLHLHPVRMAWGYFPPQDDPAGRCSEGNIITAMCKHIPKSYGTIIQNPALGPGCFASITPWISGADMKERMKKYQRTAHLFALTRDRGSGSVGQSLEVDYRIRDPSDKRNMDEGLEIALRILIAAGATEVGTHHSDGRVLKVDRSKDMEMEIQRYLKENGGWCPVISAHQMGSCRMGVNPSTSCVDEKGESWEIEGLFLSDASVFPTALGVNPMITIQSIALCISNRVSNFLQQIRSSHLLEFEFAPHQSVPLKNN